MEGHDSFGGSEYGGPELSSGQSQKHELNETKAKLQQDAETGFDPRSPYSSSMDDVPLKLLFGISNLKTRRRALKKTKEVESPPKNVDNSSHVQSKVQELPVSPLEIAVVEQHKKDEFTGRKIISKVAGKRSAMDLQTVETKDTELHIRTFPVNNGGGSDNTLKQSQGFRQTPDLIMKESEGTQMSGCLNVQCGDSLEDYPHKRIKLEKEERTFSKKACRNQFKQDIEKVHAPSEVVGLRSEVIDGGSSPISRSQVRQEPSEVKEVASLGPVEVSRGILDNCKFTARCSDHKISNTFSEQLSGVTEPNAVKLDSIRAHRNSLPAIISLNEYIKSKKDQSNDSAKSDAVQYKSREDQSNDSVKTGTVLMKDLLPDQKKNQEKLHSNSRDDLVHKLLMVGAGPNCGRKISTGYRIAESYSKLVGLDGRMESRIEKSVKISPDEKIWDGCLQLNAYITVLAVAFFKSGVKTRANNWSKFVEVKGRVRLDAFEKFLQELPLSRNRALMVISIRQKVSSSDSGLSGMQEIANSYRQGERVGFAELAGGVDLYVCPPDETMIHMLAKYGFIKNVEIVNRQQDDLIGCVVWRKNYATSNAPPKIPEQYINAKKLALFGVLLDSPSHPGVSQCEYGNDGPKIGAPSYLETISTNMDTQSDKDESRLQTTRKANQIDVRNAKADTEQITDKNITHVLDNVPELMSHASDTDVSPAFSPKLDSSVPHNSQTTVLKASVETNLSMPVTNSDLIERVPGEFGSKATTMQNGKGVQNCVTQKDEDDDDLPEFDFTVATGASQMLENQILSPCSDVQSLAYPQCPVEPSTKACNLGLSPPVSMILFQCQLGGHNNKQQISQTSMNPRPFVQISDLIQKFHESEAMALPPPLENCRPKVPGPNISGNLGSQPATCNLPHISPNSQTPHPPGNEAKKSLWDDDDDMPEWCPPYLEQRDCPATLVTSVVHSQLAMPVQCSLQPQSGMQKFAGNLPKVHPPPLQVVPPLQIPTSLRGPPPLQAPSPRQLPPSLRGPPHLQAPLPPQLPPSLRGPPSQSPNLPWGPSPCLPLGPPPSNGMIQPVPRPVTKRDHVNMDKSNSATAFYPLPNVRPPYCKPDFTPLRPVNGSGKRFG